MEYFSLCKSRKLMKSGTYKFTEGEGGRPPNSRGLLHSSPLGIVRFHESQLVEAQSKSLIRRALLTPRDSILQLQKQISQTVLGQEAMIERLLIGLLANGNLLVEGLPGLAKTRAIKKLSTFLDAGLSRIQFTPDLLPSD